MINRENYELQAEYLNYVENIKNRAPETVQRAKIHTNHFLIWLDDTPIRKAHKKEGNYPAFISSHRLREGKNENAQFEGLHPTTQKKTIQTTKRFLRYLKLAHPDKVKELPMIWIESLTPVPAEEMPSEHVYVSMEEILLIANLEIPDDDLRLRRAQAAACLLFVSGMRNNAHVTLPIQAVDLEKLEVKQWPKLGVQTKNGKHATTFLLNIPEVLEPIRKWDHFVNDILPPEAMWFAPFETNGFGTKNTLSARAPGKNRSKFLNSDLEYLFTKIGLPYKSAHKFRHGHAVHALTCARTMAQYKAISQNLMHSDIRVTDQEYAWFNPNTVRELILTLSPTAGNIGLPDDQLIGFLEGLSKDGLQEAISIAARLLANT